VDSHHRLTLRVQFLTTTLLQVAVRTLLTKLSKISVRYLTRLLTVVKTKFSFFQSCFKFAYWFFSSSGHILSVCLLSSRPLFFFFSLVSSLLTGSLCRVGYLIRFQNPVKPTFSFFSLMIEAGRNQPQPSTWG
jgi:hypothetical protein